MGSCGLVSEVDFLGKVGLVLELKELRIKSCERVESLIGGGVMRLKTQAGLAGEG